MAEMRDLVKATLDDLGLGDAQSLGERVLILDRIFVGVRFVFEGVSAIWLADADHLRFVDDSGRLLKIVGLDANHDGAGKAA